MMIEYNGYIGGDNYQQYVPYYHGDERPKNSPIIKVEIKPKEPKHKRIRISTKKYGEEEVLRRTNIIKTLPKTIQEDVYLTPSAKVIYYYILKAYKENEVVTYERLTEDMETTKPAIRAYISRLKKAEVIKTKTEKGKKIVTPLILE